MAVEDPYQPPSSETASEPLPARKIGDVVLGGYLIGRGCWALYLRWGEVMALITGDRSGIYGMLDDPLLFSSATFSAVPFVASIAAGVAIAFRTKFAYWVTATALLLFVAERIFNYFVFRPYASLPTLVGFLPLEVAYEVWPLLVFGFSLWWIRRRPWHLR